MGTDEAQLEFADPVNGRVRTNVAERGAGQAAGSLQLHVGVRSIGFEGEYDGVWIEAGAARKFVEELATLGRTRTGTARMESMSPAIYRFNFAPWMPPAICRLPGLSDAAALGRAGRFRRASASRSAWNQTGCPKSCAWLDVSCSMTPLTGWSP